MTQDPSQQPSAPSDAGDRWSRRPRRSRNDRKIAGVAGGLGRAFGIDPVVLRIAFVVLAIFGGSGVLLYALCWLLLPADGDEVSAIEAVLGRGRSSVSPMFTILLIVIALSSAGSVFSWGLPFWPVVIGAIVVFLFARRNRTVHGHRWNSENRGQDWNQWGNDVADRANRWANDFSDRASRWGQRAGQWGGPWGGPGSGPGTATTDGSGPDERSPFDGPAFWDAPRPADHDDPSTPASPRAAAGGRDETAESTATTPGSAGSIGTTSGTGSAGSTGTTSGTGTPSGPGTPSSRGAATSGSTGPTVGSPAPSPSELLTGSRTPPAWDPLGVAPFAWDLPEPSPAPAPRTEPAREARRSALSRAFVGIGLLAGALAAVGVIAGWWALSWAEVSAIALSVIGVGLIIAALRGRGRPLIGPGIFLALLTLALTVTGLNGTQNYGEKVWTPASVADIDNQTFAWNAGDGRLDLSGLSIPADTTATTTLDVRAGRATVLVPSNVTVHATCSANIGQVDCLTASDDGMRPSATDTQPPVAGSTAGGTLDLTVRVGAGHVTVRHG